jgi:hypothetical protein
LTPKFLDGSSENFEIDRSGLSSQSAGSFWRKAELENLDEYPADVLFREV